MAPDGPDRGPAYEALPGFFADPDRYLKGSGEEGMNNNELFESRWEQIRSQSKLWWSLFSEETWIKWRKPRSSDKYGGHAQGQSTAYTRETPGRRSPGAL
jgi:hypothetical protein